MRKFVVLSLFVSLCLAANIDLPLPTDGCLRMQRSRGIMAYNWGKGFDQDLCAEFGEPWEKPECYAPTWMEHDTRQQMWQAFSKASAANRMDIGYLALGAITDRLEGDAALCQLAPLRDTLYEAHARGIVVYALFAASDAEMTEIQLLQRAKTWNSNCEDSVYKFDGIAINNEHFTPALLHHKNATKCSSDGDGDHEMTRFLDQMYQAKHDALPLPLHFSLGWFWGMCDSDQDISLTWGPPGMPQVKQRATNHMMDIVDSIDIQASTIIPADVQLRAAQDALYAHKNWPPVHTFVNFYLNPTYDACDTSLFPLGPPLMKSDCPGWESMKTEEYMWQAYTELMDRMPTLLPSIHYYKGVWDTGMPGWPKSVNPEDPARAVFPPVCDPPADTTTPFIAIQSPPYVRGENTRVFVSTLPAHKIQALVQRGEATEWVPAVENEALQTTGPGGGYSVDVGEDAETLALFLYDADAELAYQASYEALPSEGFLVAAPVMHLGEYLQINAPASDMGTLGDIHGMATAGYELSAVIQVGGRWFSRPSPGFIMPVSADGSFQYDFTWKEGDENAEAILLLLYPIGTVSDDVVQAYGQPDRPATPGVVRSVLIHRAPFISAVDPVPLLGEAMDFHGVATPNYYVQVLVRVGNKWHSRPAATPAYVVAAADGSFTVPLEAGDVDATHMKAVLYAHDGGDVAAVTGVTTLASSAFVATFDLDRTPHIVIDSEVPVSGQGQAYLVGRATPGYVVLPSVRVGGLWTTTEGDAATVSANGSFNVSFTPPTTAAAVSAVKLLLFAPNSDRSGAVGEGASEEPAGGLYAVFVHVDADYLWLTGALPLIHTDDHLFGVAPVGSTIQVTVQFAGVWYFVYSKVTVSSAATLACTGPLPAHSSVEDACGASDAFVVGTFDFDFTQVASNQNASSLAAFVYRAGVTPSSMSQADALPSPADLGAALSDYFDRGAVLHMHGAAPLIGSTDKLVMAASPGHYVYLVAKMNGLWSSVGVPKAVEDVANDVNDCSAACVSSMQTHAVISIDCVAEHPAAQQASELHVYLLPPSLSAAPTLAGASALPSLEEMGAIASFNYTRTPYLRVDGDVAPVGSSAPFRVVATRGHSVGVAALVNNVWVSVSANISVPVSGEVVVSAPNDATRIQLVLYSPDVAEADLGVADGTSGDLPSPAGALYAVVVDRGAQGVRLRAPVPDLGSTEHVFGEATLGNTILGAVRVAGAWYPLHPSFATTASTVAVTDATTPCTLPGGGVCETAVGYFDLDFVGFVEGNAAAVKIAVFSVPAGTEVDAVTTAGGQLLDVETVGAEGLLIVDRSPFIELTSPAPALGSQALLNLRATPGGQVVVAVEVDGKWYSNSPVQVPPAGFIAYNYIVDPDTDAFATTLKAYLYGPNTEVADMVAADGSTTEPIGGLKSVVFHRASPHLSVSAPLPVLGTADAINGDAAVGYTLAVLAKVGETWSSVPGEVKVTDVRNEAMTCDTPPCSSDAVAIGNYTVDFTGEAIAQAEEAIAFAVVLYAPDAAVAAVTDQATLPTVEELGAVLMKAFDRRPTLKFLSPAPLLGSEAPLRVEGTAGYRVAVVIGLDSYWYSKPALQETSIIDANGYAELPWVTNKRGDPKASKIKLFLYAPNTVPDDVVSAAETRVEPPGGNALITVMYDRSAQYLHISDPVPEIHTNQHLFGEASIGHVVGVLLLVDGVWYSGPSITVTNLTTTVCEDSSCLSDVHMRGVFEVDFTTAASNQAATEVVAVLYPPETSPPIVAAATTRPNPEAALAQVTLRRTAYLDMVAPLSLAGTSDPVHVVSTAGYQVQVHVLVADSVWEARPSAIVPASGSLELPLLSTDSAATKIRVRLYGPDDVIPAVTAPSGALMETIFDRVSPSVGFLDPAPIINTADHLFGFANFGDTIVVGVHVGNVWYSVYPPHTVSEITSLAVTDGCTASTACSTVTGRFEIDFTKVTSNKQATSLAAILVTAGNTAPTLSGVKSLPAVGTDGVSAIVTLNRLPALSLLSIPAVGVSGVVQGTGTPGYQVAASIKVGGVWYSKPSAGYLAPIRADGHFSYDFESHASDPSATALKFSLYANTATAGDVVTAAETAQAPEGGVLSVVVDRATPLLDVAMPLPAVGSTDPLHIRGTPGAHVRLMYEVGGEWLVAPTAAYLDNFESVKGSSADVSAVVGAFVFAAADWDPAASRLALYLFTNDAFSTFESTVAGVVALPPTADDVGAVRSTTLARAAYLSLTAPLPRKNTAQKLIGHAAPGHKVSVSVMVAGSWYRVPPATTTIDSVVSRPQQCGTVDCEKDFEIVGVFNISFTAIASNQAASQVALYLHDDDLTAASGTAAEVGALARVLYDRSASLGLANPVPVIGSDTLLHGVGTYGTKVQLWVKLDVWYAVATTTINSVVTTTGCDATTCESVSAGSFSLSLGSTNNKGASQLALYMYPPSKTPTEINSVAQLPTGVGETKTLLVTRTPYLRVVKPYAMMGTSSVVHVEATPGHVVVAMRRFLGLWSTVPNATAAVSPQGTASIDVAADGTVLESEVEAVKLFLYTPAAAAMLDSVFDVDEEPVDESSLESTVFMRELFFSLVAPFPPQGSMDKLHISATPGYKVAVLAKVGGVWYSKPRASFTLDIPASGLAEYDFISHPKWDPTATDLMAFLYHPNVTDIVVADAMLEDPEGNGLHSLSPAVLSRTSGFKFYLVFGKDQEESAEPVVSTAAVPTSARAIALF